MENNASLIEHALKEANKTLFSAHSLRIELLKNCTETIPTLAEWVYEDWHPFDASLTKERLISALHGRLHTDQLPITFVVLKNSTPVAMTSLKKREATELADLEDDNCWQGTLHVVPKEREKGLGGHLIKFQSHVAKQLGHKKIKLYISDPEKTKWYTEQGAKIIETRPFRGHTITIMEFVL